MMSGPIQRFTRSKTVSRQDQRLPSAWIDPGGRPPAKAPPASLGGPVLRPAQAENNVALVMIGEDAGPVQAELARLRASGSRVYLLAGRAWGASGAPLPDSTDRLLARRAPEAPATCVVEGAGGQLWIGGGWSLALDPAQAAALRQVFLRLFWHEATDEAWFEGATLQWRKAGPRPFDVPEAQAAAAVRLEAPGFRLPAAPRGALVHLLSGAPPEATPLRLWCRPGPDHHGLLAQHSRAGCAVRWTDRGLPDLNLQAAAGEALLPGGSARLRVQLNPQQAAGLAQLLSAEGAWRFQTDVQIGDPALREAKLWLPEAAAAAPLEPEQRIELPELPAPSLRAAPDTAPAALPGPQPLACSARYEWGVAPPRVPSGAAKDGLAERWRAVDAAWARELAEAKQQLSAAAADQARVAAAFPPLSGAILGFSRTQRALSESAASLGAELPSRAGPSRARGLQTELVALEEAVAKLIADVGEAERRAREQKEREEQRAAWQARTDGARRDLRERRAELSAAEIELQRLTDQLQATQDALAAAPASAERKAENSAERADLLASQRKLSDELQRSKKLLSRLQGEITALETIAESAFELRPTQAPPARAPAGSSRFVPAAPSARPPSLIPEDALPEVGELRSHKGQRYLVIDTWEQLSEGERAAHRLNATLVAPEHA